MRRLTYSLGIEGKRLTEEILSRPNEDFCPQSSLVQCMIYDPVERVIEKNGSHVGILVFLDAMPDDAIAYFDTLLPKLRMGGCIVTDNITYPPAFQETMRRYQEHVRSHPNVRSYLLSIGHGEEMSVRIV